MLQETGGAAGRSGVKRKADEPTVDREILLMEDVAYLFIKWDAVRDDAARQQPEPVKKTRGCVDTRFQYSAEALGNIVGMTAVLQRLYRLWRAVCEAEGLQFAAELSRESIACQLELAQVSTVKAIEVVSKDPWHKSKFDFSASPRRLNFNDFLNTYSGRFILPQLDVLCHRLNPARVDTERLQAAADDAGSGDEDAEGEGDGADDGADDGGDDAGALSLPKGCPVQALTLQKLPALLLDLVDTHLAPAPLSDKSVPPPRVDRERKFSMFPGSAPAPPPPHPLPRSPPQPPPTPVQQAWQRRQMGGLGAVRGHFPLPANSLSYKRLHQLPECAHGAGARVCRNTLSRPVVAHSQRSVGGSVAMLTADSPCRHCAQDAVLKHLRDQLMPWPREV